MATRRVMRSRHPLVAQSRPHSGARLDVPYELYGDQSAMETPEPGSTRPGSIPAGSFTLDASIGNVHNGTGEVIIDDSGITIYNGKINLIDASGESVLTAAGFAGSWLDFIAHGLYNASCSAPGVFGALTGVQTPGASTAAPYWGWDVSVDTTLSYDWTNGYFHFASMASTDVSYIQSSPVGVSSRMRYQVRSSVRMNTIGAGSRTLRFEVFVNWYDIDGDFISASTLTTIEHPSGVQTDYEYVSSPVSSPATAAFASVKIGTSMPTGSGLSASVDVRHVSLLRSVVGVLHRQTGSLGLSSWTNPLTATTGSVSVWALPLPEDFAFDAYNAAPRTIRAVHLDIVVFVASGGTDLDASNKWTATLYKIDNSNASTSLGTAVLDSGGSNAWHRLQIELDADIDVLAYPTLRLDWAKTGTPGTLNVSRHPVLSYRDDTQ